jgi:hypothetical protein
MACNDLAPYTVAPFSFAPAELLDYLFLSGSYHDGVDWEYRMSAKKYLTPAEAAEKLGVSDVTIRSWMKRGRLPSVTRKVTVEREFVPVAALKDAFKVTCDWCGNDFTSKHPEKARFCSREHASLYFRSLKHGADKDDGSIKRRRSEGDKRV